MSEYQYESQVNHPKHYSESGLEPVEVIQKWNLDFFTGNALKYIARAGRKPSEPEIKDLEKAVWYLQEKIRLLKES